MALKFKQVDVFTATPFKGNPVAVVFGADDLDTARMQRIAHWTNLSETTFLLKPTQPGATHRVRIFTPQSELAFAGHPTLGTAHAAIEGGVVSPKDGKLVQECRMGLVGLTIAGEGAQRTITLDLPKTTSRVLDDAETTQMEAIIGAPVDRSTPPRVIDVGPKWITAQMKDAAAVRAVKPDLVRMPDFEKKVGGTGVVIFGRHTNIGPAAVEVRAFAPSDGVPEDPVCGSGNGCVAVFIRDSGLIDTIGRTYAASQGFCVGRDGRISVDIAADGAVKLGGHCVTVVDGSIAA
jgi:PhzF family phenazine biosynthesis protein